MIVIIGAGPVGCFLGGLLAKEGKEVAVYEEHKVIGRPLQCTGIVTEELGKIVKLKRKFVVNRLNKVKINSLHNSAELKLGKEIVLDRVKFDQYLAKKALDNGAGIFLEHKYLGYRDGRVVLADKKNRFIKIKADKIIGADGPLSDIAKSNGFFGKRDFLIGMQARVKGNFQNYYEVNFGICKDFFGWVVPENKNIARMGIGSRKNAGKFFENFLKFKNIKDKQIIDKQAGLIPVYGRQIKVQKGNIFLLGDAAAQVKATTGGGLVPGLRAAKILANCILYERNYKNSLRKLNRELWMHFKLRQILNKFSDKDWDKLVYLIKQEKVKKVLNRYNRDSPFKLIKNLILREPRFLRYTIKFLNKSHLSI